MKPFLIISAFILLFGFSTAIAQDDVQKAKIDGTITDFDSNIKIGETIIFENSDTKLAFPAVSNDQGKFEVQLPYDQSYVIKIKGFNDDKYYTDFTIPALEPNQTGLFFTIDIQIEMPKLFTLDNVYFDTGKATLKPASYTELDELFDYLNLKKTTVVEIAGHTDDVGTDEDNLDLSQRRAESVRNYLIKKGIDPSRIQARGYGESSPVADNSTAEGRASNRRTEVRLITE